MENEDRIDELLAKSIKGQDRIVTELKATNHGLNKLEKKNEKIEEQFIKLTLQNVENSRAILTLAEKIDQIADLQNRVSKLEKSVFK